MATVANPFVLYTAPTPNGRKVSIHLEELKAVYPGIDYDVKKIDMSKDTQKEPWFIDTLNPNGRIPVLIDRTRASTTGAEGFSVFETAAITVYLSNQYDKDHKFWFDPVQQPEHYSEMLQWIFFIHGGIGPMQGQSNHFTRFAPEKIPYAMTRYQNETRRLYGVLELRLKDRDYLAGPGRGKYSIADMNGFPWVVMHKRSGLETIDEFPLVKGWLERINARPAVQAGLAVPSDS